MIPQVRIEEITDMSSQSILMSKRALLWSCARSNFINIYKSKVDICIL